MTGVTSGQIALATCTDSDDAEVFLTGPLTTDLQAVDNLFHNSTGHDHSGAGKGKPITTAGIADGQITPAKLALTTASNVLAANVTLNNIATYFDGPSMAQGSVGTWLVIGSVAVQDTGAAATFNVKLWDGTTVIASAVIRLTAANTQGVVSLAGIIASPAGNVRISVNDSTNTTGLILANQSGNSKDASIFGVRIG